MTRYSKGILGIMEATTKDGLWQYCTNDEEEDEPNTLSLWYKTKYGYLNVANIDIDSVHMLLQVNNLLPDGPGMVSMHETMLEKRKNERDKLK